MGHDEHLSGDLPSPPCLTNPHVILRPVVSGDYDFLYAISTSDDVGFRWRYQGFTPSPEDFVRSIWEQVQVQFLVERRSTEERIGLVVAYSSNPRNGFTYLGSICSKQYLGTGLMVSAVELFIDYLFTVTNFRKIYIETAEFNLSLYRSGLETYFHEEGRLEQHQYFGGRYWDQVILAIHEPSWRDHRLGRMQKIAGSGENYSLTDFTVELGRVFEIEPQLLKPNTTFIGDLGFDSLALLELVTIIEELAGPIGDGELTESIEDELLSDKITVSAAYSYYCTLASLPRGA